MSKEKVWALVTLLLIAVIVSGTIITWVRYRQPHPIEILLPTVEEIKGEIYIGGAVNNPGFYPLRPDDTIQALIEAAGGTTDDADISRLKLHVSTLGEQEGPQKVNINRAEAWLLEALPGIGQTKAQAIIEYRQQHGAFKSITQITEVEGIGPAIYEKIKDLITVAE